VFITCAILLLLLLPNLAAQEPAVLQVRILEGEGAAYPVGTRATRGITVQVTDEIGTPVEGAAVSFQLPADGPGGAFATGAKTEIATNRADGRASIWGMRWNRTAGAFEIRVTAAKGKTRAGAVCSAYLVDSPGEASPRASRGSGHGRRWLWVSLAIAGAAAGGVAAVSLGAKPGSSAAAASTGVQIGAPTIILGHP
jgi:hypothetical protein